MRTQEEIDKIFTQLRMIHTAHWKPPTVDALQKEIVRAGVFVFRIGASPWVAEVKITSEQVAYEINLNLPQKMKIRAQELKKKFDEEMKKYGYC